jgi:molybdate-binding protein
MRTFIALAVAAVVAGGAALATVGPAAAATAPTPHYKPLICGLLPFLCKPAATAKPAVHHVHHVVKTKKAPAKPA